MITPDLRWEIYHSHLSVREAARHYKVGVVTVQRIRKGLPPEKPAVAPGYVVQDALEYLESFPIGTVSGVVSSPPYNKGLKGRDMKNTTWRAAGLGLADGYAEHGDNLPWHQYVEWQRQILKECLRIVGPAGVVLWNFKPTIIDGELRDLRDDVLPGLPLRQEIIWCRGGDLNQGGERPTFLTPSYEKIYLLAGRDWRVPAKCRKDARVWGAWWRINANPDPKHPASFPLELATRMVSLCGGAVLDPFAGSGTTGIAAKQIGYPYYLCDNAVEYRGIFEERLKEMAESGAAVKPAMEV